MSNLESLDTARANLSLEQRPAFYNYLLGALSVLTSPEAWEAALDSAKRCVATYSALRLEDKVANKCVYDNPSVYDLLYDERSASDVLPERITATLGIRMSRVPVNAPLVAAGAETKDKLTQDLADKRARALTESLGIKVEAWRSPDTGQWEMVQSTDGVLIELWESL